MHCEEIIHFVLWPYDSNNLSYRVCFPPHTGQKCWPFPSLVPLQARA